MDEIIKVKFDPATKNSGVQGVQNSEYLLRMHFLMQASELVEDQSLKRFYASEIKNIAKRNVLRTYALFSDKFIRYRDPEIKKKYCKRCSTKLDQEVTKKDFYRLTGKKNKNDTCIECPFCLYKNKVYGTFGTSVIIKECSD